MCTKHQVQSRLSTALEQRLSPRLNAAINRLGDTPSSSAEERRWAPPHGRRPDCTQTSTLGSSTRTPARLHTDLHRITSWLPSLEMVSTGACPLPSHFFSNSFILTNPNQLCSGWSCFHLKYISQPPLQLSWPNAAILVPEIHVEVAF